MTTWEPYREALRVTLMRTGAIALVVGAVIARPWSGGGGLARWGLAAALMLWPALGGHWVEVGFLNGLRPRISAEPSVQVGTRLGVWFVGGMALALGMVATAAGLGVREGWLGWKRAWWIGGLALIAIELVAHLVLWSRGRASFYDGKG